MTADDRVRTGRNADGARRQQLLAAAAECFDEVGYSAVTVEMITARAGTSRPTFYVYFKSKDEVFLALVEKVGADLIEAQFLKGIGQAAPAQVIAATTQAYAEAIFTNGGLVGLIDTIAATDPAVDEVWSTVRATTIARFAQYVNSLDPDAVDLAAPADRLVHIIGDAIHYGAMRLARADDATKEQFVSDQKAIALRLIGLDAADEDVLLTD
ncbi:MAG: helix-turn-helix domain-containing protein [Gordonia sp. (in: high G+C Gram-positive bacteria)]